MKALSSAELAAGLSVQPGLKRRVAASLLGTVSFLVMVLVSIPIIPSAAYLKYEPSGAVLLLTAALIHPAAGLLACFVKDLLYFFATGANIFGVMADFLCTGSFALTGAWLLRMPRGRVGAAGRILPAVLVSTLVMIPANFAVLYLQFGMSSHAVWASMPAIIPFNLVKGTLNGGLYLFLAPPLVRALGKR